jgi:hypothetical protein
LLTGAGASFCVKNADASKVTSKTAPSLKDLWTAVKSKVGEATVRSRNSDHSARGGDNRNRKAADAL